MGPRQLRPVFFSSLLQPVSSQPPARDSAIAHGMRISANLPPVPQPPPLASAAREAAKPRCDLPGTHGTGGWGGGGGVSPLPKDLRLQGPGSQPAHRAFRAHNRLKGGRAAGRSHLQLISPI